MCLDTVAVRLVLDIKIWEHMTEKTLTLFAMTTYLHS